MRVSTRWTLLATAAAILAALATACGPKCVHHCTDSVEIEITLPAGVEASEIVLSDTDFSCYLAGNQVELTCFKDEQRAGAYSVTVSAPGHPDRIVDYTLVNDDSACTCGVIPVHHQVSWS